MFCKFQKINRGDFKNIYGEMESAFIKEERRTFDDAYAVLDNEKYTLYGIFCGGERVGFISLWTLRNVVFIEHFAIRSEYRNKGYGGAALDALKKCFPKMILEAEPPESEIASRRIAFYQRAGFVLIDGPYMQPSYHGGEGVRLVIMSYPSSLDDFDETVKELYSTVYNVKDA